MSELESEITPEFIEQQVARGKEYVVSMFTLGPRERNDEALLDELQMKHLQHIYKARKAGMLVLNGPFLHGGNLRGLSIWNATHEQVALHLQSDPLVQAGFLRFEIYPWFGMPGDTLP